MLFKFYKIYASLTTIITILYACIQSIAAPNAINEYERSPGTEQLLIERLFNKYNKKLRPPGTVNVEFALNLNQIVTLNQKDQIIVLNAFIDHAWTDPRLVWDPEKYDNISIIRIAGDQLWTPDTFIYTTADQTGFLIPQLGAQFVIQYNGSIFWPNPLTQMQVRCRMGIKWFPFDDQMCIIVFGSWSFTCNYLNYTIMGEPSLDNYTENNEWELVGFKPFRHEIKYTNWIENDFFTEIRYKILIRRKPLFVLQNCVIPAIMLCILTLVSFFIPFASEMQIGISIMLAFSVFKLRLSDDVPVQSDSVPLVNIYFTLCMSFSLTAMIWFSYMNLLRNRKNVPKYCRYLVVNYICLIMCINTSKMHNDTNTNKTNSQGLTNANGVNNNNKRKTYSLTVINQDGINKNILNCNENNLKYPPKNSPLDRSYHSQISGNSKIAAYYKKINDNSFISQFNKFRENRDDKSSHRKKHKSPSLKEKTHSDSEFENELERLKQKKRVLSCAEDEMNIHNVSDTCEDDFSKMIWIPQKRVGNHDKRILKATKIKQWEHSPDGEVYFPIKINYDSSQIDLNEDAKYGFESSHSISPPNTANCNNNNRPFAKLKSNESLNICNHVTTKRELAKHLVIENRSKESQIEIQVSPSLNKKLNKTPPTLVQQPGSENCELSDARIIKILNEFVFFLFLLFCILLNLLGLFIFPYYIKQPLTINSGD